MADSISLVLEDRIDYVNSTGLFNIFEVAVFA